MAGRCRRFGCRFSVPGTDRCKEVASHEEAADLEGQSTVKPEAWALHFAEILGQMSDAGGAGIGGFVGVPTFGKR